MAVGLGGLDRFALMDLSSLRTNLADLEDHEVILHAYELSRGDSGLRPELEAWRCDEFFRRVAEIVEASRSSRWVVRERLVNQLRLFCEQEELARAARE